MQAIIPRPDIAPVLQESFVALAGDADDPEAEVQQLLFKVKNATMLPILVIANADGSFVSGASGAQEPNPLKTFLEHARDA